MTSTIKVDNIQDQDGNNIINENANTITIGASGDTVILASGASQSGFGRSGTVNWQTTPKTATFTAVNGEGYFCNTSGGAFTVNLPAGSAGAIVSLSDYARTWQTNALTVSPNGSEKIGGEASDATLNTEGQSVTFVYVDGTEGWINVQDSTSAVQGRVVTPYITATGGTITCCGDYKIHTFTGPGTFDVTNEGTCAGSNTFDYLVVAGGGGGGANGGGGGGGGGHRTNYPSSCSGLPASFGPTPITVGSGGAGAPCAGGSAPGNASGTSGSNSVFLSITSAGGGGAGNGHAAVPTSPTSPFLGKPGGAGGGGGSDQSPAAPGAGGTGNTPPVSPPQGANGGTGVHVSGVTVNGGGGGGGGASGSSGGGGSPTNAGNGGPGTSNSINGSSTTRAGGGGGGAFASTGCGGSAGSGGGGSGRNSGNGFNGTGNTGGGGGGGKYGIPSPAGAGGGGGSGIVIIRYKYQN